MRASPTSASDDGAAHSFRPSCVPRMRPLHHYNRGLIRPLRSQGGTILPLSIAHNQPAIYYQRPQSLTEVASDNFYSHR